MLKWDDSFETGVPEVDDQHKELITNFNALLEALSSGHGRGHKETGKILDYLKSYAVFHFESEERYMDQYDCPAAEANKVAHKIFLTDFGDLYEKYQTNSIDAKLMMTTAVTLSQWIANHIITIDAQLHDYVKERQLDD